MSSHLSSQDIEEGYYPGNSLLPVTYPAAVDSSPSATPFLIQPSPAPSGSQNTSWVAPAPFQNFADDTSFLYPTYNNPSSIAPSTVSPQVSPAPSAVHSPSFSAASTVSSLSSMHSPPVYDNLFFGMNNYQLNAVPELSTSEDIDPNMPLLGWDSLPGVMNAADAQLMPSQLDSWFLPFETCEYETPKAPLFPQAPTYQCETSRPYSTPIRPAAPITSMPQPVPTYQQTTPVQYSKKRRASSDSPVARRTKRCTTASGEGVREKGRCPYPGCGRSFKDLKAHMLTHQSERPEKCPLVGCEYHFKGFARKYDKNRHTLTHYRGTMVCGFCPGAGTPAETSFDRTDAFKKHLISAHKVEQTAPNCRKRSPSALEPGSRGDLEQYCPGATGKCSTCSGVYGNAQDFYEHLDECVLKAVFPVDNSEAVNARHLTDISKDEAVKETLRRNGLYDEVSPRVATSTTYQPEQNGYDSEGSNAGNLYSVPNHGDSLSVNT
ncbi:hypothetical protein KEM56_001019 [Ascosphaera pollenicola]|nr:hypothetical protein KEM56_001019 [Ascosphaera pollenicola]